jgi:hypothetical protein
MQQLQVLLSEIYQTVLPDAHIANGWFWAVNLEVSTTEMG